MVEVVIQLPDGLASHFGETDEARSRRLLEASVIEGYRAGNLSHRQAGELLGLDYWTTDQFFAERGVPLNYSVQDLEADRATLEQIFSER